MNTKNSLLIACLLLAYSQLYGMNTKPEGINAFSKLGSVGSQYYIEYVENGNPWADEDMPPPSVHDFRGMKRIINQSSLSSYTPWLGNVQRFAAEYNKRYEQWRSYSNDFIKCVAYKQQLLTHLAHERNEEKRNALSDYFKALETRMAYYAQQLTARRQSGEEHHVRYAMDRYSAPIVNLAYPKPATEWAFVQSIIDACNTGNPALLTVLNPTSMAAIRRQTCEGLQGVTYKKTIERTQHSNNPPSLCIIKMPGDQRRHMPFAQLRYLLFLRELEDIDLDTEMLWQ